MTTFYPQIAKAITDYMDNVFLVWLYLFHAAFIEGRQSSFSNPKQKISLQKRVWRDANFDANIHPAKKVVFFWQGNIQFLVVPILKSEIISPS